MAITVEARSDLISIVVGMFNAAPGAAILSDLTVAFEAGQTRLQIATNLAKTAEYLSIFPEFMTNAEFATKLVDNMLGSLVNAAGKAEAVTLLTAKLNAANTSTPAAKAAARADASVYALDLLKAVPTTDGTFGAAAAALANKVEVATFYSVNEQQNPASVLEAQEVIEDVDNTAASVTTAKAEISGEATAGQTFTLGIGVDAISGTSFNDTINALSVNTTSGAAAETLNSFDSIDGGNGSDTLNIYTTATENEAFPTNTTVKNVEIVNVYNSAAAAALADASKFTGVEQLWQIGAAAGVTNLGVSTTAGFKTIPTNTALSVTPTTSAASANVALDAVTATGTTALTVGAAGGASTALNAVNVSGSITGTGANLALTVNTGAAQTSLALNTAVATTLTIGTAATVNLDASASTGKLSYTAGTAIRTIKTGAGDDTVSTTTTTSATVSSVVETGAGKDAITITNTGTGTTTVSSGDGDDTITIAGVGSGKTSVSGGAGNDKVTINGGIDSVKTTDVLDGGDGTDILSVAGKTFDAEDYIVLTDVIKNFETLNLTGGTAAVVDASKLTGYTKFDVATTVSSTLTKVASGQQVVVSAAGGTTVSANGYAAPTSGNIGTLVGTLNVSATAANTIVANGETINLTVSPAASDNDGVVDTITTTLDGDLKTASVTLVAKTDTAGTTATTDDVLEVSNVTITTANAAGDLDGLTSVTVSGNGTATITNGASTALATVDVSGLAAKNAAGTATAGLTYVSTNAQTAETVTLGASKDAITLAGSQFSKMDTITGLNLVDDAATGVNIDFAKSDDLTVKSNDNTATLTSFAKTTTTATTLNLALVDLAASATDQLVFQFGGDTYIFADVTAAGAAGDNILNDSDILIKLTGTVDLDLLVDALNTNA